MDHGGENRGGLNLKEGGLTPIASLARWMSIVQGDVRGGTLERIQRASSSGLLLGEESEILSTAFTNIHQLVFDEEIAAILKISPGTVDSRLFRARRQLRKKMAPFLTLEGRGLEGGGK